MEPVPNCDADREARRAARWLAQLSLGLLAVGFAWFAYVDAPITDGAMWLFTAAVIAALLAVTAALCGSEITAPPAARRWRRAAQLLLVAALALMLAAATVTLNLRGTGSDDSDTQTAAVTPA